MYKEYYTVDMLRRKRDLKRERDREREGERERERERETGRGGVFVCLFGFLMLSSTTRLYRGRAPIQSV